MFTDGVGKQIKTPTMQLKSLVCSHMNEKSQMRLKWAKKMAEIANCATEQLVQNRRFVIQMWKMLSKHTSFILVWFGLAWHAYVSLRSLKYMIWAGIPTILLCQEITIGFAMGCCTTERQQQPFPYPNPYTLPASCRLNGSASFHEHR